MPGRSLLYYVTDRKSLADDEPTRRRRLLGKIAEAARCGVDYIQLREKDLSTRGLEQLAREALNIIRENSPSRTESGEQETENREPGTENDALATGNWQPPTALLINSRTDVALAAGADGVHLRSDDVSPAEVRIAWKCGADEKYGAGAPSAGSGQALARENSPPSPIVAVSCHSSAEVAQAASSGANFAVFAPIFEKLALEKKEAPGTRSVALAALEQACRAKIPVLALGGITLENAQSCLEAGAAGIAAIRLFQENNIAEVVYRLRAEGRFA
jgi:thiamine-phosphate pyrophosphorylase